jgi:hypothetical protein
MPTTLRNVRYGQRLALKANEDQRGTVTKVCDGRFKVTYDAHRDKTGRRVPGGRFEYLPYQVEGFIAL